MTNQEIDRLLQTVLVAAMRQDVEGSVPAGIINRHYHDEPEPLVEQIKQVFMNAGWVPPEHDPLKQIELELKRLLKE